MTTWRRALLLKDRAMDKVYYLDLQTLLEYLQGQSALLTTEVAVPGQREGGTGYLFFKGDRIIGCVVKAASNALWSEGEQAYQMLRANGEWRVRMEPDIEQALRAIKQQSAGAQQAPPASPAFALYTPRPLLALDPALLQQFPPRQRLVLRLVYALVNGQRTPTQIKAQLRLPAEAVDEAIQSLHDLGIIE
ncbi:MAG TPA: hypothetical protein VH540_25115 [Ktedonobacterales bacterium]